MIGNNNHARIATTIIHSQMFPYFGTNPHGWNLMATMVTLCNPFGGLDNIIPNVSHVHSFSKTYTIRLEQQGKYVPNEEIDDSALYLGVAYFQTNPNTNMQHNIYIYRIIQTCDMFIFTLSHFHHHLSSLSSARATLSTSSGSRFIQEVLFLHRTCRHDPWGVDQC